MRIVTAFMVLGNDRSDFLGHNGSTAFSTGVWYSGGILEVL